MIKNKILNILKKNVVKKGSKGIEKRIRFVYLF